MDKEEVKPTGASAETEIAEPGFTPGPWAQSALAAGYVISLADDHEVICSFVEYNKDGTVELEFKNAVSNMALAIAAPALYDAIGKLLAAMEMQEGREKEELHITQREAWHVWTNAKLHARAALALVDGPTSEETNG